MTVFLMLLLILCIYPIVKVIFYIPVSALLKNHQNRKSLSLIITAVLTIILFIILLVLAYVTMGYTLTNNQSIFNSGPEFYYFIGFTYVLGLFAAVVLLVLKVINMRAAETIPPESLKIPETAHEGTKTGIENIILILVIGGFAALILFIFYIA